MFWVYVIQNEKEKIYIGQTADLEKRLARHNKIIASKSSSFTAKNNGIWKIVYTELFSTRKEAMIREKELKSYQGRHFIKKTIKNMTR